MIDERVFIRPPYCRLNGLPVLPHPRQRLWHRNTAPRKYLSGGYGSGKSLAGSREFMTRVFVNAERASSLGYEMSLEYVIGAPTLKLVRKGPLSHIREWLAEARALNGFSLIRSEREHPSPEIVLETGDLLSFVTLRGETAGANAAGGWLDEAELAEDPLRTFQQIASRVRDARIPAAWRFLLVTSTPPRGSFGVIAHFRDQIAKGDDSYAIVTAKTSDNPAADADYVRTLEATMSESEIRQLLEGELVPDEAAVYGLEFDPHESIDHAWDWYGVRADRQYYIATDWGGHFHAVWIEHDPETLTDVVFDELTLDGLQDEEWLVAVADHSAQKWGLTRQHIDAFYCDYNPKEAVDAARKAVHFGDRVRTKRIDGRRGDKEKGIKSVKWRMKPYIGERKLKFAARLRHTNSDRKLLDCFMNYKRAERIVDGQVVLLPDVIQDSPWSHGPDALRSYVWPRYGPMRWEVEAAEDRREADLRYVA